MDNWINKIKNKYNSSLKNAVIIKLALIAAIFYLSYSLIYYYFNFSIGSQLLLLGGFSQLLLISIFIFDKLSHRLTAFLGVTSSYVVLLIDVYFSGGFYSQSILWIILIPIYAFLLLENNRVKIFWFVVSTLTIIVYSYLDLIKFDFPIWNVTARTQLKGMSLLGLSLMVILVIDLFEKKKQYVLQELLEKEIKLKETEELRKTKDELRLSEERWKFAIDASKDGIWDYNYKTGEVYRSPRWAEIIGYDIKEIRNEISEWKDRVHPQDRQYVEEEMQKHFRGEIDSYVTEHRLLCKDGSYKWVLDRGKVIRRAEDGSPIRIVGTKTDITKRKKAEEELKQNEEKLQAIFEGSNDAIMLLTENGFFDCNDKGLEMFQIPSKEAVKSIHPADISPEYQEDERNSLEKADEMIQIAFQKGTNRFEWLHKRLNGEVFPCEVSLSAFMYGNEMVLQATVQDITKRKLNEENLKQSEAKYRSLIENSPEIIMIVDIDEKIEFINLATQRYERDQIIGKSLYGFVSERHHEEIKKCNHAVLTGQSRYESFETQGTDKNGNPQYFLTHVGPKIIDNKITGLVLFISNITDKKLSEEKVRQSLSEKEILLKEVHHRVKNNLQIISSILNLQSSGINDPKILEILTNSQHRIRSMSLIHELLYQTKDFSTISFAEYIQSIATNLFHGYNQNSNIKLDLDLSEINLNLDLAIPCGLIVNELITNALKYAFNKDQKGEVLIKLCRENQKVFLTIKDDGKGFPSNLDYRNTSSLGMQLVVSLVGQLDGNIVMDIENGTTFRITFEIPEGK